MKDIIKIKGLLASKGLVQGKVIYFHGIEDMEKVTENSIVISDKFSKEYTAALVKCAAFVATSGGITSHAAIVCREFKKPCVVSCQNAFELFEENSEIEFDATNMQFKIIQI
jgi:pyruvate,water dikinase